MRLPLAAPVPAAPARLRLVLAVTAWQAVRTALALAGVLGLALAALAAFVAVVGAIVVLGGMP